MWSQWGRLLSLWTMSSYWLLSRLDFVARESDSGSVTRTEVALRVGLWSKGGNCHLWRSAGKKKPRGDWLAVTGDRGHCCSIWSPKCNLSTAIEFGLDSAFARSDRVVLPSVLLCWVEGFTRKTLSVTYWQAYWEVQVLLRTAYCIRFVFLAWPRLYPLFQPG